MLNTNYSVDILVNNKPIRKIAFDNKIFVEARAGQEYSIRIKNNSYSRVLVVSSVDGLDTLNGKVADENANGYVINGCNSLGIDGFRVSNTNVGRFIFDCKNESYASTKEDDSEKNVGIIGIRIFAEKIHPVTTITNWNYPNWNYPNWNYPNWNYPNWTISTSDAQFGNSLSMDMMNTSTCYNLTLSSESSLRDASVKLNNAVFSKGLGASVKKANFDMGTKFGPSKESAVIEVEFERGLLAFTENIYYASCESLIAMGVPMENEKQVSFPEPFPNGKYATPPKSWKA